MELLPPFEISARLLPGVRVDDVWIYTEPALLPWFKEATSKQVRVLEWRGSRVLVQEIDNPRFLIDCDLSSIRLEGGSQ